MLFQPCSGRKRLLRLSPRACQSCRISSPSHSIPATAIRRRRSRRHQNLAQLPRKKSKKLPLERVIYGLGIRMVGERTAQFLAEHFGSMDALLNASQEELEDVNEVGPKIAESIAEFFHEPRNRELVKRLRDAGLTFAGKKRERGTTRSSRAASPSIRGPIILIGDAGFGAAAFGPNPLIDVEATPGIEPGYTVLQTVA